MAGRRVSAAPFAHTHWVRCWDCITGACPGGRPHPWADTDDIAYALAQGFPSPEGKPCGCRCVQGGPQLAHPSVAEEVGPCQLCGSDGPCGYDADGRPMVHADYMDPDVMEGG